MAYVLAVPKFSGPLNPTAISHWLWRCTQAFKKWEKFYQRALDDETKIEETGNCILDEGDTKPLFKWWVANARTLVNKDWDGFCKLFQNEALGSEWGFKALKEYYSLKQEDGVSVKEYFDKLQNLAAVIGHIGDGVPPIDTFTEKCHLLFGAKPKALESLVKSHLDAITILKEDPEVIIQMLEKHAEPKKDPKVLNLKWTGFPRPSVVVTPKPPKPPINLSMAKYIIGSANAPSVGGPSGARFNDLDYLDLESYSSSRIRSLKLFCRSVEAGTLLSYEIEHTKGSFSNPPSGSRKSGETTIYLDGNDYIKSYKITHQVEPVLGTPSCNCVRDMLIETSEGKTLQIGRRADKWDADVTAPEGWGIVGFYGSTVQLSAAKLIYSIGCIFARV